MSESISRQLTSRTTRRDALGWLGVMTAGIPSALAQSSANPIVGYLGPESPRLFATRLAYFREGLAESGYHEGRNVILEFRWAEGHYDRLPGLARQLVEHGVKVLVAPGGAPVALAAKSATPTIPVIFEMGGDPVALGVVDNLARPPGNVTGISSLSVDVSRKRLEFLRDVVRKATAFTVIINPTSPTARSQLRSLNEAAESLGVELQVSPVARQEEFEPIFASVFSGRTSGIVFTSDPYFANRSQLLAELALRYKVPAITQSRDFVLCGGLLSYGGDFTQSHLQAGIYTGEVLKGKSPKDLPVQLVTKVEFFINAKTAGLLGLIIPPSLLSGADTVIE
ncbi:ABC transporter substrate-binding protein [Methylobacterium brachythecii]|uniref:ABC transporter substrate-binding protein n=1 Tax=Methylobacterium brachythecii TaxID=1176177 RepID=UPI0027BAF821|nr:ABC transporter substrate-binding protein [Methylobacterium brachythecii]